LIAVISAWLVLTDSESFSRTLSFLGLIVVSLLGGAFPVLLLIASRRKGEYVPGVVYHILGTPLLTGGIFLLTLADLFIHGLVIWQNPLERGVALATGLILLGATGIIIRRGGLLSRVVIELRKDYQEDRPVTLAITAAGKPAPSQVELIYQEGEKSLHTARSVVEAFDQLRYANLQIPEGDYHDVKVWVHQVSSVGDSQSLPAQVEYCTKDTLRKSDPGLSHGQIVIPLTDFSSRDQRLLKLILEG
jgi:hypothetical protein